jgi:hypothetical protein
MWRSCLSTSFPTRPCRMCLSSPLRKDKDQVLELRNHLVASHWISEDAVRNPGTVGFGEADIQRLGALTLKDTELAARHPSFGTRVLPGQYRSLPISVRSNPLRIFPYHFEVPACMRRFFQWCDKVHREKRLHPLLIACQTMAYFIHNPPLPRWQRGSLQDDHAGLRRSPGIFATGSARPGSPRTTWK